MRRLPGLRTFFRRPTGGRLPPGRCPMCGVVVERFKYWLEDPEASVFERVVVTRCLPCGHEFNSRADVDAGPVRPGE